MDEEGLIVSPRALNTEPLQNWKKIYAFSQWTKLWASHIPIHTLWDGFMGFRSYFYELFLVIRPREKCKLIKFCFYW